jgi:glycosyltransferase involved in cell wall biosynthesis
MKVLWIAFDSEELSIRTASALAAHADVCLMLPQAGSQAHLSWLSPKVDFQPFPKPRMRQPLRQVRLMTKLVKRIRRLDPDVIHLQKGHLYFNLCLPLLRQYPLVVSIHDPRRHLGDREGKKTPQPIMDLAYRRADHVIAHNESMKEIIVDEFRLAEHAISIVPLVERGDAAAGREVTEAGNQVLFFGRIWKYKGLEYLIRAEPLITAELPDTQFVIAGEGEDFGQYRQMMVHPQRFVVHNEFVSYQKCAELFRRVSVVVLPYVEATQSGVIPVAYTYGKPVVATAVGGLPSQVDHGKTGFVVPPGDETALAEAIVRLMRDKQLRRTFGDNGRRKMQTEWSAEVVAEQTVPVYRKAIDAAKRKQLEKPPRKAAG